MPVLPPTKRGRRGTSGHRLGSVKRLVALLPLVCAAVAAPAKAEAPPVILPSALMLSARDVPGFAHSKRETAWSTSALAWARENSGSRSQAAQEAAALLRHGFQEAVLTYLRGRRESRGLFQEAVAEARVFATAAGAEQELANSVAGAVKAWPAAGLRQSTIAAIPGSHTLGAFVAGQRGATENVMFASARCFFVIGDSIHGARTRAQAERAPVTAAIRLYGRAKQLCR